MVTTETFPMARGFRAALADADDGRLGRYAGVRTVGERDGLAMLLSIHELHTGPVGSSPGRARWQHHPVVADLKIDLEARLRRWLDAATSDPDPPGDDPRDAVAALRMLARTDRIPAVYQWVAEDAAPAELIGFLSLEGGPDDGFDDLVAACQIGLDGRPKMEMARNYWDEMGRGVPEGVHRALHRRFCRAVDLPEIPRHGQPVEGLRRSALNGYLATNRNLQPEMIGALGLTELQAGPRCRKVVAGLRRIGAPGAALDFYLEHADTDPVHGKAWLDEVVAPLCDDPVVAAGIVRGARWRSAVNRALFDALGTPVAARRPAAAVS